MENLKFPWFTTPAALESQNRCDSFRRFPMQIAVVDENGG
jgi:hypothetical protein